MGTRLSAPVCEEVLDRGGILEEGTHDGLLARGGHYAELYNTYFRHQSIEYIEQPLKEGR